MYADAGEYIKAIELLCENNGVEPLMDIVRQLKKTDVRELRMAAEFFQKNGHHNFAKQVYIKMDAIEELLRLHMQMHKWEEALALAEQPEYRGKFDDIVYLPYAEYLAGADRFDEAQAAFKRAGRPEESLKLLSALAECATIERRFEAAASYYKQLSQEHLRVARELPEVIGAAARAQAMSPGGTGSTPMPSAAEAVSGIRNRDLEIRVEAHRTQSAESETLAGVYFAYSLVHQYTEDPFTSLAADVVFSASCFLMNTLTCKSFRNRSTALHISGLDPPGVSRVHVLYALAQTCTNKAVAAYKLARWAIKQLQTQAVPSLWQDQIDRTIVSIQSKPFSDREELNVTCNRCLHTNPLINNIGTGDACVNCGAPFVRCYGTWDVLPMVEFAPTQGISFQQAVKMLSQVPGGMADAGGGAGGAGSKSASSSGGRQGYAEISGAPQRMNSLNGGDILGGSDDDEFGGYGMSSRSMGARGGRGRGGAGASSSAQSGGAGAAAPSPGEEAFNRQLMKFEPGKPYKRVTVDAKMLLAMNGEQCTIVKAPSGQITYLRNMLPEDTQITTCNNCGSFFRTMSFEFAYLRDGGCPFCKSTNTGTDLDDVETRSIEASRKAAIARGENVGRVPDRWEVVQITAQ